MKHKKKNLKDVCSTDDVSATSPHNKTPVPVINSLNAHADILATELDQIDQDLRIQRAMIKKYGPEGFIKGEKRLTFLKDQKDIARTRVLTQLENIEKAVRGSKRLAKEIEKLQLQEQLKEIQRQNRRKSRQAKIMANQFDAEDDISSSKTPNTVAFLQAEIKRQLALLGKENSSNDASSSTLLQTNSTDDDESEYIDNGIIFRSQISLLDFEDPYSLQERLEFNSPILLNRSKQNRPIIRISSSGESKKSVKAIGTTGTSCNNDRTNSPSSSASPTHHQHHRKL